MSRVGRNMRCRETCFGVKVSDGIIWKESSPGVGADWNCGSTPEDYAPHWLKVLTLKKNIASNLDHGAGNLQHMRGGVQIILTLYTLI